MSKGDNSVLTLNDIRRCMKNYEKSLVYQQDFQFYQATSQPKWMSAILSQTIVGCMTQNSGDFENSEASNIIHKETGTKSHNVDVKLQRLYEELIRDDYRAITEQEKHLHIVLSQCAYIATLNDSKKWSSLNQRVKLSDRYKDCLSSITSLSPEGRILSKKITSSLIDSIGLKIGRQCLPYTYTSNDAKESDLSKVLGSIDSIKLLTATIIIAVNYQNNFSKRRNDDAELDALTKRIHQFLLSKPKGDSGVTNKSNCEENITAKNQENDLEQRIFKKIIEETDALDIDTETFDLRRLLAGYFSNLVAIAEREGIQSIEIFASKVEEIAYNISDKIIKLKTYVSASDDISNLKQASLEYLDFFLWFKAAEALVDFCDYLLKNAMQNMEKENAERYKKRFENMYSKYKQDTEDKKKNFDAALNDALSLTHLNNTLV